MMKTITIITVIILSLLVEVAIDQYFFCPVYTFSEAKPFSGDFLYNPYAGSVNQDWVKCNFHAHSRCWDGMTNGKGSATDINKVYAALHYGVHEVSNYESVDTTGSGDADYINSYEHGYNVNKVHQLVLGASGVCYKDFLFPQTINNKQHILNCLSADTNALVILNHPLLRGGYNNSDLTQLTGYTCMEVLNPSGISSSQWDAALSAGKPVFIVGNDDVHNIFDSSLAGRMCTIINTPAINKANILTALKTGNSYAMAIDKQTVLEERRGRNILLPSLQNFSLNGNRLGIKFNMPAKDITISGDGGKILLKVFNCDSVNYTIGNSESYVREVATYENGTQIYLNPVFRYKEHPFSKAVVGINKNKTLLNKTIGYLLLLIWFYFAFKIIVRKSRISDQQSIT